MKVAVIDYKMGNIMSVCNALRFLGADPTVIRRPSDVAMDRIIIPGVGSFGDGMRNLRPFAPRIRELLESDALILGICLGMQMFFEGSEEAPTVEGLGIMAGRVVKIETDLRLPHIGWNRLEVRKGDCPLFRGIDGGYVYFVHSYHADPSEDVVAATTDYGGEVCAAVWRGNVFGTQFHLEKSGVLGLRILSNFLEL